MAKSKGRLVTLSQTLNPILTSSFDQMGEKGNKVGPRGGLMVQGQGWGASTPSRWLAGGRSLVEEVESADSYRIHAVVHRWTYFYRGKEHMDELASLAVKASSPSCYRRVERGALLINVPILQMQISNSRICTCM